MKPEITFIFVNFQSAELLRRSLSSVQGKASHQGIPSEYIIINNDPKERLAVDSLSAHVASPRISHQAANGGFGNANNVGAQMATGEVLFFINPDTEMVKGDFRALLAAFHDQPKALYGMALSQMNGEREPWSSGEFPSLFRVLLSYIAPEFLSHPWRAHEIEQTDWVSGAALAIRKDFFHSLTGFDPEFFLYFEDVDLARRASDVGGWVGVYPYIEFCHVGGQSHRNFREKKKAYYTGQRKYFKKWRPAYELAVLSIGQRIRSLF